MDKSLEFIGNLPNPEDITYPSDDEMNAIYFVAGYICRSVLNRTKCRSCRNILVSDENMTKYPRPIIETHSKLLELANRGGLLHPSGHSYHTCILCWKLNRYIISEKTIQDTFLLSSNQKSVFINLFQSFVKNSAAFVTQCESNHNFIKMIVGSFFNCSYKIL